MAPQAHPPSPARLAALSLGALGIVYGDIGTSPLYALRESFEGHGHELSVTSANVLGVLSLIFWSLIIVISVKYLIVVMRADNRGEGGILALTSLLNPTGGRRARRRWALILIGLFGTALLYGDGMITPAISVLAAVEGTEVASPVFEDWVIPIAALILVGLFSIQSRGTARIGAVFGPVMIVWFATLAALGLAHVAHQVEVLEALNPVHGFRFFRDNELKGFLALGSVFLVVTGGEALYADMGHFGRRPIQLGWFGMVLPALLLNYFGQGAMLLDTPEHIDNPFYRMAPAWAVFPLVVLATAATVIASQALISGVFSLTRQAAQLGYTPRVRINHTSPTEIGQIYVPGVNWALMLACIGLVVGFRSSASLAAAYGVAVTATMGITTVLLYVVLLERFRWSRRNALAVCTFLLVVDLAYFGANIFKVPAGGWFPLAVGAVVFAVITTWRTGRRILAERIRRGEVPLEQYLENVLDSDPPPARIGGTAVYLFSLVGLTPPALIANVRHNNVIHERVIVLSIATNEVPRVLPARRSDVQSCGHGFYQVVLHYGFMEDPDVPRGLTEGPVNRLGLHNDDATYFLGAESLVVTARPSMAKWREHLFAFLQRNATSAANYYGLPFERTMTVGMQVDI